MLLVKGYYHMLSWMKILCYRLIYSSRLKLPWNLSFRRGFHIAIEGDGHVKVGNHCFFNNYCTIAACTSVTIGDGTIFGENVKIYDHNHRYADPVKSIKEQGYSTAPVNIGRHCWIGSNVVILKGVTIGDNCVIGAGCIIYKDVQAGSVVVNKQDLMIK